MKVDEGGRAGEEDGASAVVVGIRPTGRVDSDSGADADGGSLLADDPRKTMDQRGGVDIRSLEPTPDPSGEAQKP